MARLGQSLSGEGTNDDSTDAVDIFDPIRSSESQAIDNQVQGATTSLPRWLTPLALAVAVLGAAALVTRTGPAPIPVSPTTTEATSSSSAPEDEESEPEVGLIPGEVVEIPALDEPIGDVFVAPVTGGYVVIDPSGGTIDRISAGFDPIQLEAGADGYLVALSADGRLERSEVGGAVWESIATDVVGLRPSATPGHVWISRLQLRGLLFEIDDEGNQIRDVFNRTDTTVDPRFRWEPGGGTYRVDDGLTYLGPHQLMAAGQQDLLGRTCDERAQCWMEWWNEADGWQRLRRAQDDVVGAQFSATGDWIVLDLIDDGIQLVSTGSGSTFVRHPSSLDTFHLGLFSTDGSELYIVTADKFEIIELDSFSRRSVDLPAELIGQVSGWVVVPRPANEAGN